MLQHSAAERFKRTIKISKQFLPRRQRRAKLPRKQWPKAIAREYFQQIVGYLNQAHELVVREIGPLLPGLAAAGRHDAAELARLDAGQSEFNKKMDELSRQFFDRLPTGEIERLAEDFARRTSSFEKSETMKEIRAAFGVDVMANEPNLASRTENFVAENVALIKSIPSQFFDDIEKQIMRAVSAGQSHDQLAQVIQDRYNVAQDRATLIARDQLGKFYGNVAGARQQAMGVTHYIWRTSNDERVREEHAAREGESFAWDDPPEDGNPGEAINCRCYAEPDLTPLLEGDEPLDQSAEPDQAPDQEPEAEKPAEPSPEDIAKQQAAEADQRAADAEAETARLRDAHEEEQSKRLAEQEIARENMRLLRESMAKQEAEAARLAAEHEAELARLAAEKQAAEDAARAAAAEQARLAAEAEAKKFPLRQDHLDAVRGLSDKNPERMLALDREAHLTKMLDRAPDPGKIAAALGDLSKPKAQAAAREELNRIVAHEGARISEGDLRKPDGKSLVVDTTVAEAGASAIHTWDGEIQVAGGEMLKHAQDFMRNVSIDPDHYRNKPGDLKPDEQAFIDTKTAEKQAVEAKIKELTDKRDAGDFKAKDKKALDALRQQRGDISLEINTVRENARQLQLKTNAEITDTNTLIHETMHGHSPMLKGAYSVGSSGVPVEEISTELAARATMERQFGVTNGEKDLHWRSYSWFIGPAVEHADQAFGAATGNQPAGREHAYQKLTEASLAMKRDHVVISTTPAEHLTLFANHLADAYGMKAGKERYDFVRAIKAGFENDIRHRTGDKP